MDQQLVGLLEFVRVFTEPRGPDPWWWDELDRREAEWERSRSTDDLLALVGWLKEPTCPPDPPDWAGPLLTVWLSDLVGNAAYLVGHAARGNRAPRLLRAILGLLADPRRTETAVVLLTDMDESIYALMDDPAVRRVPFVEELAAAATPELAGALDTIARVPGLYEDYRLVISAIVDEWRRLHSGQAGLAGPEGCRPGGQ